MHARMIRVSVYRLHVRASFTLHRVPARARVLRELHRRPGRGVRGKTAPVLALSGIVNFVTA